MKNLIFTLMDTTKERLKNPFVSSFLLAWLAFNWRPIFYLFKSNHEIGSTIKFIDENYLQLKNQLLLPIIFAIIYVLFIPYLMLLFDWLSKKAIIGRKENVTGQKLYDIELRIRLAEQENKLETIKANYKDKADLNRKIEKLQNDLAESKSELTILGEQNNELIKQNQFLESLNKEKQDRPLTEEEVVEFPKEYKDFSESDYFEYFEKIGSKISENNKIPYNIERLIIEKFMHNGIIKEIKDKENEQVWYEFTRKGKSFWKEFVTKIKLDSSKNYIKPEAPF